MSFQLFPKIPFVFFYVDFLARKFKYLYFENKSSSLRSQCFKTVINWVDDVDDCLKLQISKFFSCFQKLVFQNALFFG